MKGYKVFNPDFTCRGMQYEVGKTYKHDGPLKICRSGFHFCREVADCFNYYSFDPDNKVAEIEATGFIESDDDKSVTDEITIVREIPWAEMLKLANQGKGNAGLSNTGNKNTGGCNTGDWNAGNWNTGYFSSITPKLTLFEQPTDLTADEINNIPGVQVLDLHYENNWWIYSQNMTDEEKTEHPEHMSARSTTVARS